MDLDRFFSTIHTILVFGGAIFLAKGILKASPEIIAKQTQLWLGWNNTELINLVAQKADVTIGIALIFLAFFVQICNLVFIHANLKTFNSHWQGISIATLISLLIILVSSYVSSALFNKYKTETEFSLAKSRQEQLLIKYKKLNNNSFDQILFDAKRFFEMEPGRDESKVDFLHRYSGKLNLIVPEHIDLKELEK